MKKDKISLSQAAPTAYCDWEALRKIEPATLRYEVSTAQLPSDHELYTCGFFTEPHIPEFEYAKLQAVKTLKTISDEHGYNNAYIAMACGFNKSLISLMFNGTRSFCIPLSCMESLRDSITHLSCHQLMFGEPGKIILPHKYGLAAMSMERLERQEKSMLAQESRVQVDNFQSAVAVQPPEKHSPYDALLRERMSFLIKDNSRSELSMYGRGATPYQIKAILWNFWDSEKHYEPRLSFFMYAALETGIALDYFICENVNLGQFPVYIEDNGVFRPVKSRTTIKFLNNCLMLPEEQCNALLSEALSLDLFKK